MKVAFCTVITKRYLAYARALARGIRAHNGDVPIYVFLADRVDGCFDPANEPFHVIPLDAHGDDSTIAAMTFYYDSFELCTALRARAHRFMLEKTDAQAWCYIDSDVLVTGDFAPVWKLLESHTIVLSPHILQPVCNAQMLSLEVNCVRLGRFNGGFLGVSRRDPAPAFIQWFVERMDIHCTSELTHDQRWLGLVPDLFPGAIAAPLKGLNVGYWNLHERDVRLDPASVVMAGAEQMLFFHFSGWELSAPDRITKFVRMKHLEELQSQPWWKKLRDEYRASLLECGLTETMRLPYSFATARDGKPISYRTRKQYYSEVVRGIAGNIDPFGQRDVLARRGRAAMLRDYYQRALSKAPASLRRLLPK